MGLGGGTGVGAGYLSLTRPLKEEDQAKRGWSVSLDGQPVERVASIEITNKNFGVLTYGKTPAGYDGWSFRENGGGGSVIVPHFRRSSDGMIMIGLIEENRHNLGGKAWNCPGGFLDPGETHIEAASREAGQEMGAIFSKISIKPIDGEPVNPNRAFFETPEPDEGVKFYAMELVEEMFEVRSETESVFRLGLFSPKSKLIERILAAKFVPWKQALKVKDSFTCVGVGRLIAMLP